MKRKNPAPVACPCQGCGGLVQRPPHMVSRAICPLCKKDRDDSRMRVWRQTASGRASAESSVRKSREQRHAKGLVTLDPVWQAAKRESSKGLVPKLRLGMKNSPLTSKGVKHHSAKRWLVRSPENVVYDFVCLAEFIRGNLHLFPETATRWYGPSNNTCAALIGISSLHPLRAWPKGSWRGWTWVSEAERMTGNLDILNRSAS